MLRTEEINKSRSREVGREGKGGEGNGRGTCEKMTIDKCARKYRGLCIKSFVYSLLLLLFFLFFFSKFYPITHSLTHSLSITHFITHTPLNTPSLIFLSLSLLLTLSFCHTSQAYNSCCSLSFLSLSLSLSLSLPSLAALSPCKPKQNKTKQSTLFSLFADQYSYSYYPILLLLIMRKRKLFTTISPPSKHIHQIFSTFPSFFL